MARARNIKPAFFTNENLAELTALERLAFIGMWTIADFKGCIEFRPKRLKIQLLPYDECDFEIIAINLDKSGFILNYSVQGKRYIKIINFERHQNPHKNEKLAGSEIPNYEEKYNTFNNIENIEINLDKDGTARADSLIPLTDSLNLIPDSMIPEKKHTRKETALDSSFNEFWNSYPTKVGKDAALKAWIKKKPPIQEVLNALSWQVNSDKWKKGFIENPSTYINAGNWKDEPQSERAAF